MGEANISLPQDLTVTKDPKHSFRVSQTRYPHVIHGWYWTPIKERSKYYSIFSLALAQGNAQRLFMFTVNLGSKQCLSCLHYVSIIWWTATCLLFVQYAHYFSQLSYLIMWSRMHVNLFHERHHLISKTFTLWNARVVRSFALEGFPNVMTVFPKLFVL